MIIEKFVNYFSVITFFVGNTSALGPKEYCKKFAPQKAASSSSAPINLDLSIGLPDVTQSHYYASSGQTSANTSEEVTMYTFIPTKEEEERSKNNNIESIRIRKI